ncbi:ADP-ribose pyrophosphatase, mitochondrial isoform X1 [Centruroides vittatus]|uniref:ADP-ribose pyrophosphatase, mitochondrial isoform X1 n=2 Tax=Centruroides vittatus TaxID=120091 RepID=UPI00350FA3ED
MSVLTFSSRLFKFSSFHQSIPPIIFVLFTSTINSKGNIEKMLHVKCRNTSYSRNENIKRFPVPDDKVSWEVHWPDYKPTEYTISGLSSKPWADPEIGNSNFKPKWNELDGNVNRRSYVKKYEIFENYPLNPIGRTGLRGRGCLGRWGPNHAADPIVTRWKRENKDIIHHKTTKRPILQFVSIQRHDCGEWAIPGGMIDPGEFVSATLKREFCEEALNSLCLTQSDKQKLEEKLEDFFKKGKEIYKGYVDDPRNTDNAWMETVAYVFHDDTGESIGKIHLEAGDDAAKVCWTDIDSELQLYASHKDFLRKVAEHLNAHW